MSGMQWDKPSAFTALYEELLVPAFFAEFSEKLLDRAAPRNGERMLDLATGTGIVVRRARDRHPGLGRVVGLDLNAAMLAQAREHADGLDVEFVEGDATALPFEDDSFDLVTCQQGLQFFPDRERALRDVRRVLVPGGRAVFATWCEVASSPAHNLVVEALRRQQPEHVGVAMAPYSFPDEEDLRSVFEAAGFADVSVERVDGTGRFASPETLAHAYVDGTPIALVLAELPGEARETLMESVTAAARERFGEEIAAPMATHIAVATA